MHFSVLFIFLCANQCHKSDSYIEDVEIFQHNFLASSETGKRYKNPRNQEKFLGATSNQQRETFI